jgi:hypothetical protein
MVIQAGAGRLAEPWQSDVATGRFATIRQAGVQALAEADRLVTMMQVDGIVAPRLTDLLERARTTGACLVVTSRGDLTAGPNADGGCCLCAKAAARRRRERRRRGSSRGRSAARDTVGYHLKQLDVSAQGKYVGDAR